MTVISKRAPARVADKTAPRFRRKAKSIIDNSFINEFILQHPEYKDVSNLNTLRSYKLLLKKCNQAIFRHCIDNRDGVDLPQAMGVLFVGSKTSVYSPVDYGLTNKLGYEVRITNMDTNGLIAKIYYSRHSRDYNLSMTTLWNFKPTRGFQLEVSKAFKEKYNEYRRIENKEELRILFEQRKKKAKKVMSLITNYNEFE